MNGHKAVRPIEVKLSTLAPDISKPSETISTKSKSARAEPSADATRANIHCLNFLETAIVVSLLYAKSPNDQLTDGGPPLVSELPERTAGPPFGAAPSSALCAWSKYSCSTGDSGLSS